jgi:hypothetical protein
MKNDAMLQVMESLQDFSLSLLMIGQSYRCFILYNERLPTYKV